MLCKTLSMKLEWCSLVFEADVLQQNAELNHRCHLVLKGEKKSTTKNIIRFPEYTAESSHGPVNCELKFNFTVGLCMFLLITHTRAHTHTLGEKLGKYEFRGKWLSFKRFYFRPHHGINKVWNLCCKFYFCWDFLTSWCRRIAIFRLNKIIKSTKALVPGIF